MANTIGLVFDLRDAYLAEGLSEEDVAEFDTEETIRSLEETIAALGFGVERIGHGRRLAAALVQGRRWDLVFNVAEGLRGRSREAQVPAMLELYGQPYTFSDPLACAVTLDKAVAKRILLSEGIPTAPFAVVEEPRDIETAKIRLPAFAKPLAEGTGKGTGPDSIVRSGADLRRVCESLLRRYRQPVIVEQFLPGREFTVGILGTGASARVIGTMEISVADRSFAGVYSLQTKEQCEHLVRYSPAPKDSLRTQVEDLALRAYRLLGCRDAGRADFRLDEAGRPMFLEMNPLPGLHPTHSDLPMIATQAGMSYRDLIGAILASALQRKAANAESPRPHTGAL